MALNILTEGRSVWGQVVVLITKWIKKLPQFALVNNVAVNLTKQVWAISIKSLHHAPQYLHFCSFRIDLNQIYPSDVIAFYKVVQSLYRHIELRHRPPGAHEPGAQARYCRKINRREKSSGFRG